MNGKWPTSRSCHKIYPLIFVTETIYRPEFSYLMIVLSIQIVYNGPRNSADVDVGEEAGILGPNLPFCDYSNHPNQSDMLRPPIQKP